jgi:photosystem II stability/assembly factor-like uncharacterized protein
MLASTLLLACGSASAGSGIWSSSGPEGGLTSTIVAAPSTANTFYAGTRGGVFKSIDGGLTWSDANAGINRQLNGQIIHSETAADVLYAFGATKVYHSDDAAATWSDRSPVLPANVGLGEAAASKTSPGRLYVVLSNGDIIRTDDSGLTWNTVSPGLSLVATDSIWTIETHPVNVGELLVSVEDNTSAGNHRLIRVTNAHVNGGAASSAVPCPSGCPWESAPLRDIEFFGTGGRVWATGFGGAARSDDFGATWTVPGNGGGSTLSVHPSDQAAVYVAGRAGLAFTTDDGATWSDAASFVGNGLGNPASTTDVTFDPFNPAFQLAATQGNGVYRNLSAGSNSYTPEVTGFNATNIRSVALGPSNRLHAGVGDAFGATFASFRSTTLSSITWGPAYSGLQADQLRALEIDPNDTDVVYGGGSYFPQSDGSGGVINGNGGIYKSTDGGATWTTIDNGIPLQGTFDQSLFGTVRTIEIDETSALGGTGASQKLLAGGSGRFTGDCSSGTPTFTKASARIFASTDAGASWTASDVGLGGAECGASGAVLYASVVQIVQSTVNPSHYWAATFIGGIRDTDNPTVVENGVFRSVDGGATWTHSSSGLPRINGIATTTASNVLSLAFDPTDATGQTLYASSNEDFLGTVYKTVDGGTTWTFAGTGLSNRDVRDLVVDPGNGDVYAAVADPASTGDGGVFVSEDGGASWSSISTGFPPSAVATKLALDGTGLNPVIHAGTTRGVQSFERLPDADVDGASNQAEDAAPGTRGLSAGDGNGDGVADRTQADVASPRVIAGGRGLEATLTAAIVSGTGVCDRIENAFGLELLANVPGEDAREAPFNGLHLRIPDCEQAEVQLVYHGRSFADDPTWQIRGYGLAFPDEETTFWTEIAAASVIGDTWTFVVEDGQPGDATPDDGVIVFQGGVKRLAERFFADGMEAE